MTRFRILTTILLAFAVLAAACGDDGTDTTAGSDPDDPAVSDDPDPGDVPAGPSDDDDDTADDTDDTADQPLGGGPYPIADITFDVDLGDGTATSYRLACLGDTATFTGDTTLTADQACLALNEPEVRSRLLTDDHLDRICTEQYGGPQVATVTGTLDDEPVDAAIDRVNGCGIDDWDRLLAALLPNA